MWHEGCVCGTEGPGDNIAGCGSARKVAKLSPRAWSARWSFLPNRAHKKVPGRDIMRMHGSVAMTWLRKRDGKTYL